MGVLEWKAVCYVTPITIEKNPRLTRGSNSRALDQQASA